ncbi:MAG TPA: hypothetical protein VF618_00275 [Thermoanaerobaculia bacterium]
MFTFCRAALLSILFTSAALAQEADLLVTKNGPSEAAAGTDVSYEVTVVNLGPDAAADITLDDPIPAGMTFVDADQTGGPAFVCTTPAIGDPGNVTCTGVTLAAGATATFTFVFNIPAGTPPNTTFTNIASVTTVGSLDPNDENNLAPFSTSTPAAPQGDLAISKSAQSAAAAGSDVPFTLTITNAGPDAAENVVLTDTLPGDMTFVSLDQPTGPGFSCTTPAIGAGGTVTCTAATLAAGASATFVLTGNIPAGTPSGTTYTNTAIVDATNDSNDENDLATMTVTVSAVDVSVVKSGPATGFAGQDLTYTITVANEGPDPATDVQLVDVLPAGVTFVSLTPGPGPAASCTTPAVGTNGTVACTFAFLGDDQSRQFTLVVRALTSFTNTARVTTESFDTDPSDDSSSVTTDITPAADLIVTKTGPTTAFVGQNVTYTLAVTNNGPSNASFVALADPIPAGATFVSITQTGGPMFTCNATVQCLRNGLLPGATATFELVLRANSTFTNTATVSSATFEPANGDNTSSVTTTANPVANLAVTKSGPTTAFAGSNVTYTLTVTNSGPSDASAVTLTDTIPAGATFVSITQTTGPAFTCDATVQCTIATFANGATATFELVVRADAAFTNTATVSSPTHDPVPANNTASVTTTVNPSADLSVTKNGPTTSVAGNNLTYTLSVTNNGPTDAANVTLSDPVPAGATFLSINQTTGPAFTCDDTVQCTIATLPFGATATFELTLVGQNDFTNTVTVASTTNDPSAANNTASVSTTITPSAELVVGKSGPATAFADTNVTYTLGVTNYGPSDAVNVVLADPIPAGATFVSLTQIDGPTFTCDATVQCTIALLPRNQFATFELVLAVQSSFTNTATVTSATNDPAPVSDTASVTTTVTASADLAVTKNGPMSAAVGSEVTYQLTVVNHGPSTATSVTLTDTIPAGATFVSLTQTGGPTFTCDNSVQCTIGSLLSGATATFDLVLRVQSNFSNTATVTSTTSDPFEGNNTSTINTAGTPLADLAVTKSGPATIIAGSPATYTITVTNNGPSDAVNVTLTDLVPALTFVSFTQLSGPAFNCNTAVQCSIATFVNGATAAFELVVEPESSFTNTARVRSPTSDPTLGNNSASVTTTILGADLHITKSSPPGPFAGGSNLTYTIVVRNDGPAAATEVRVTDFLPAGTTLVSASPGCAGGPVVTCLVGSLASGATATLNLTVTLPSTGGPVANTASVTSAQPDSDPTDNASTSIVQVVGASAADIPALSPFALVLLALGLAFVVMRKIG